MPCTRYIAYHRVSTVRQGRSGLGLDAQREAIASYVAATLGELLGEFTEVESGRRSDRAELSKALAACRVQRCTLIIAKLDRFVPSYWTDETDARELYDPVEGGQWSHPPAFPAGGGGLVSTAADYLRFSRMMLNKGALDGTRLPTRLGRSELHP